MNLFNFNYFHICIDGGPPIGAPGIGPYMACMPASFPVSQNHPIIKKGGFV